MGIKIDEDPLLDLQDVIKEDPWPDKDKIALEIRPGTD